MLLPWCAPFYESISCFTFNDDALQLLQQLMYCVSLSIFNFQGCLLFVCCVFYFSIHVTYYWVDICNKHAELCNNIFGCCLVVGLVVMGFSCCHRGNCDNVHGVKLLLVKFRDFKFLQFQAMWYGFQYKGTSLSTHDFCCVLCTIATYSTFQWGLFCHVMSKACQYAINITPKVGMYDSIHDYKP